MYCIIKIKGVMRMNDWTAYGYFSINIKIDIFY